MNMQEVFDAALKRLEDGTGPAVTYFERDEEKLYDKNVFKECLYLAPDGNKCVVGIFIPDGHPAQEFEGDVSNLLDQFDDLPKWFYDDRMERLMSDLQGIHDSEKSWSGENNKKFIGHEMMKATADIYQLEYNHE